MSSSSITYGSTIWLRRSDGGCEHPVGRALAKDVFTSSNKISGLLRAEFGARFLASGNQRPSKRSDRFLAP